MFNQTLLLTISPLKIKNEVLEENRDDDTCRICLKPGDIPIFDDQGIGDISYDLKTFGDIDVLVDDPYPKKICYSCHTLLHSAKLFRKTAQESDDILKQPLERKVFESDNDVHNIIQSIKIKREPDVVYDTEENKKDEQKEIQFYCKECDLSFDTIKQYTTHRSSSAHKNRKRPCSICNKSVSLYYLKKHTLLHSLGNSKKVKVQTERLCKRCDLSFNTLQEYRLHKQSSDHKKFKKKRVCSICNKSFASLTYYRHHLKTHSMDQTVMCDVCGKHFIFRHQLHRHRMTHFDDLPFQCSLCPYKARSKGDLQVHIRIHTGERPYPCSKCNKKFISKSNLNRHILGHKEKREHKCAICSKEYHLKRQLDLHFKVEHRGIKDHVCSTCGKTYGYKIALRKHELMVHKREKLKGRAPLYLKLKVMEKQTQLSKDDKNNI